MVAKLTSKHQLTIPKALVEAFHLKKGDILDLQPQGNQIVMVPMEYVLEERYPEEDILAAEKVLSKGLPGEEISFKSKKALLKHLRSRMKS